MEAILHELVQLHGELQIDASLIGEISSIESLNAEITAAKPLPVYDGDATIAVVIGSSGQTNKLYVKQNGSWKEVAAAYKKVNGSWVLQSDLTQVFQSGVNYRQG